jgi:hypothetical protein
MNETRRTTSSVATGVVFVCLLAGTMLLLVLALAGCDSKKTAGKDWVIAPHWIDVPPPNMPRHSDCSYRDCRSTFISDVVAGGPGLVAVGSNGFGEITADGGYLERQSVGVWTSRDGLTWKGVRDSGSVFAGATLTAVATGGPGLVAVGSKGSHAAVWISKNGFSWKRVGNDTSVFRNSAMNAVTTGGPGLVAVGYEGDRAASRAVVWVSKSGLSWNRVAVFDKSEMIDVTAGGPGFVAVGSSSGSDTAAVWTSKDGLKWTRDLGPTSVFSGAGMYSVAAGGPGLVAVGGSSNGNGAAWTSKDGFKWTRVHGNGSAFDSASVSDVVAGGPGLVAVGDEITDPDENPGDRPGDDIYATVWTSRNGSTWTRKSTEHYGGMTAAATYGQKLVAVGFEPGGEEGTSFAAAWISSR